MSAQLHYFIGSSTSPRLLKPLDEAVAPAVGVLSSDLNDGYAVIS